METNDRDRVPRRNASHVVEAELEHLEWATRQPSMAIFDAGYWRRRLLAVQSGYQLTRQQDLRLERILQRLTQPLE
ncbi:hypothetical protein GCM10027093_15330 [Paraburkholderia jirisanensis]